MNIKCHVVQTIDNHQFSYINYRHIISTIVEVVAIDFGLFQLNMRSTNNIKLCQQH